jgi:hypothetical protein
MTAGYSKTPLIDKLGIKPGMRVRLINAPKHYEKLIGRWPDDISIAKSTRGVFDFIHFFTSSVAELSRIFPKLKKNLAMNGTMWVSWPKGGSSIATDLKEEMVRQTGLQCGLVDVKICAVDEDWSGLKFVYRLKDRKQ